MGMTVARGSSGLTGLQGSPGMTGVQGSAGMTTVQGPAGLTGGPGAAASPAPQSGDPVELVESVHVRLGEGGHPVFGVEEARRDRGLREPEPVRFGIDGYTDSHNPSQHNQSLNQRRVATVRDALIQAGVPADRVETGPLGTDRSMCNPATEQCSPREGRVEVLVRAGN